MCTSGITLPFSIHRHSAHQTGPNEYERHLKARSPYSTVLDRDRLFSLYNVIDDPPTPVAASFLRTGRNPLCISEYNGLCECDARALQLSISQFTGFFRRAFTFTVQYKL